MKKWIDDEEAMELLNIKSKTSLQKLMDEGKKHLAISQFATGYPFDPSSLPRRNRTMTMISDATVIV